MNEYIQLWLAVIERMNNDNTYKLAWGRAILEICHSMTILGNHEVVISFDDISENILKYYWNQTYFFDLVQGPAGSRPVIQQITDEMIIKFKLTEKSNIPVWFDYAKQKLQINKKYYQKQINRISKAATVDVCWRFLKVGDDTLPLYKLDIKERTITFTKDQIVSLKEYAFVLSQLFNYRWAQLLEKFNQSPRIVSKVNGSANEKIRRSNLTRFKVALLSQYENGAIDFYSGDLLDPKDITLDHVIPWSYMYSDDIWNLVLTSKSHNSAKSNNTPSEEDIKRLKVRNNILTNSVSEKFRQELVNAENLDFVDKYFWSLRMK